MEGEGNGNGRSLLEIKSQFCRKKLVYKATINKKDVKVTSDKNDIFS